ncbi:hypothetical protein ACTMU2_23355 [Cupriavidus basilensis]
MEPDAAEAAHYEAPRRQAQSEAEAAQLGRASKPHAKPRAARRRCAARLRRRAGPVPGAGSAYPRPGATGMRLRRAAWRCGRW